MLYLEKWPIQSYNLWVIIEMRIIFLFFIFCDLLLFRGKVVGNYLLTICINNKTVFLSKFYYIEMFLDFLFGRKRGYIGGQLRGQEPTSLQMHERTKRQFQDGVGRWERSEKNHRRILQGTRTGSISFVSIHFKSLKWKKIKYSLISITSLNQ